MSLRATDHGVIAQECTNKGRALLFDLVMIMNAIEMAEEIIATLEHLVRFNEPDEVDEDYAKKIEEAYELLRE